MTEDEYEQAIAKLAEKFNVKVTKNAPNIARFRARTQLPMDKCPCEQNNTERGCISEKCLDEINKHGKCYCQCFEKK